jgi:hypothetical protein
MSHRKLESEQKLCPGSLHFFFFYNYLYLPFNINIFLNFYFIIFTFTYMYTHYLGHLPLSSCSGKNLFCPLVLLFCWRKNIYSNKKDIMFFIVWDEESYIGGFLALFPCTCVLQPILLHLYQTSSLLPSFLPIKVAASLRLIRSLL